MAEDMTASSYSLVNAVAAINAMLQEFATGRQGSAPQPVTKATAPNAPTVSPAREKTGKTAKAFAGNAAPAIAEDDWEELQKARLSGLVLRCQAPPAPRGGAFQQIQPKVASWSIRRTSPQILQNIVMGHYFRSPPSHT